MRKKNTAQPFRRLKRKFLSAIERQDAKTLDEMGGKDKGWIFEGRLKQVFAHAVYNSDQDQCRFIYGYQKQTIRPEHLHSAARKKDTKMMDWLLDCMGPDEWPSIFNQQSLKMTIMHPISKYITRIAEGIKFSETSTTKQAEIFVTNAMVTENIETINLALSLAPQAMNANIFNSLLHLAPYVSNSREIAHLLIKKGIDPASVAFDQKILGKALSSFNEGGLKIIFELMRYGAAFDQTYFTASVSRYGKPSLWSKHSIEAFSIFDELRRYDVQGHYLDLDSIRERIDSLGGVDQSFKNMISDFIEEIRVIYLSEMDTGDDLYRAIVPHMGVV